ncbi:MAG: hypothetical protein ABWW65_04020 [Thermoprotei archaeon]
MTLLAANALYLFIAFINYLWTNVFNANPLLDIVSFKNYPGFLQFSVTHSLVLAIVVMVVSLKTYRTKWKTAEEYIRETLHEQRR